MERRELGGPNTAPDGGADSPVLMPFPLPSILVVKTGILERGSSQRKADSWMRGARSLVAVETVLDVATDVDNRPATS